MSRPVRLASGVLVERVGDDVMVILPETREVLTLSGASEKVVQRVMAGQPVDAGHPAVSHLVDLGILASPGLSRRGLVKAGAIGAGAGIAVMAMPGVAAASSFQTAFFGVLVSGGWDQDDIDNNPGLNTFLGAPGVLGTETGRIVGIQVVDPPYPTNPVPTSPRLTGSVVVDGETYNTELWNYVSDATYSYWMFITPNATTPFSPFTLTFDYLGTTYTVTEAAL